MREKLVLEYKASQNYLGKAIGIVKLKLLTDVIFPFCL